MSKKPKFSALTMIVGTNTLLEMAKQLMLRGEIAKSQYKEMERRNNHIDQKSRLNMRVD